MLNRKYTKDHEWISMDCSIGTVGISEYAQVQLGDVVFVEIPGIGINYKKGEEAAVVESVKAASEVYAPVDGEIVEVNSALEEDPSMVNSDAEGRGWFYKIKVNSLSDLDELMDGETYKLFVQELN